MFSFFNYKNIIKKFNDDLNLNYQKNWWGDFFIRCKITIKQSNGAKKEYNSAIIVDSNIIYSSQPITESNDFIASSARQDKLYIGYPIHPLTGQPIKSKPLAIKAVTGVHPQKLEEELKHFGRYHKAIKLVNYAPIYFMITEYLPGEPLIQSTILNKNVNKLSLSGKSNLLFQYANIINLLHHHKIVASPTVKADVHTPALALRDIKGENTLVDIDPVTGRVDVSLTNYSAAVEMVEGDPNEPKEGHAHCALAHMSPEAAQGIITLRNDIYASTPAFTMPLGAINPFATKDNLEAQFHAENDPTQKENILSHLVGKKFNSYGLFNNLGLSDHPIDIKPAVAAYTRRMQAFKDSDRPDSDEHLRFTTAFNIFCKTLEFYQTLKDGEEIKGEYKELKTSKEDLKNILYEQAAKIAILAGGCWHSQLGNRGIRVEALPGKDDTATSIQKLLVFGRADTDVPQPILKDILEQARELSEQVRSKDKKSLKHVQRSNSNSNAKNFITIPKTFEKVDFADYCFLARPLNLLHKYELFTAENFSTIIKSTEDNPIIKVIEKLLSKNLINKSILQKILTQPELCERIVNIAPEIIYLMFAEETDRTQKIASLTQGEKFNYLHYLLTHKAQIEEVFDNESYKTIYTCVAESLLQFVAQHIPAITAKPSWQHRIHSLWYRHTVAEEIIAVHDLQKAVLNGTFIDYLSEENSKNRKIIAQSNAKVFSMFTEYFERYGDKFVQPETSATSLINPLAN